MKKIGILGAMDCEVEQLCAALKDRREESYQGLKFHIGRLGNLEAVIAKTGEGKVNAAHSATAMLCKYAPDAIINSGCMGALNPELRTLDVVVATSLFEYDLEYGVRGWPRGTVFLPNGTTTCEFRSDNGLCSALLTASQNRGFVTRLGAVATGDIFVSSEEDRRRILDMYEADGCEMEGAAVAHVCTVAGIPFAVVRSVSDSANNNSGMSFDQFAKRAGALSAAVMEEFCLLF